MSIQALPFSLTLSTECSCLEYDSEKGDYTEEPAKECYGCYADDLDNLKLSILEPWLMSNNLWNLDKVIIECPAIGWTNSAAYAIVDADVESLVDVMTIRGDYRIVFTLNGSELSAIRYSHDEPVGTGRFTFREYKPLDD